MISQFPGIDKEINDISLPLIGLYFLFIEVGVGWGWGLLMTINAKNTGGGGVLFHQLQISTPVKSFILTHDIYIFTFIMFISNNKHDKNIY